MERSSYTKRNSMEPDSRRMSYILYDQPPIGQQQSVEPQLFQMATETDLDQNDLQDEDTFDPNIHVRASCSPIELYNNCPSIGDDGEGETDDLLFGLVDDGKLMINDGSLTAISQRQQQQQQQQLIPNGHRQMGIYGWRKKTIYLLLVVIILLVGINAALTFWIVSFLGFSSNGISGIDLSRNDQIIFHGNAIFQRHLYASQIGSYRNELRFNQNNGNITFQSNWNTPNNQSNSKLTVTKEKVLVETDNFEIHDRLHRLMFGINIEQQRFANESYQGHSMTIRTNKLNVLDINSLRLPLALQTTLIDSGNNDNLRLISPNGKITMQGPKSVSIESKFGDVSMITFDDLRLKSNGGPITFETSSGIYIRKLLTFNVDDSQFSSINHNFIDKLRMPKVYQLCICQSGKLFTVNPDQQCAVQSAKDCL